MSEQTIIDHETGEIIPAPRPADITPMTIINRIAHILHAIEETNDVSRLVQIREAAAAVQYLTEKAGLELDIQNRAAAARIETERKLGAVLLELPKRDGGDAMRVKARLHDETEVPPTYADMGIDKVQAHRWQTMAKLPQQEYEDFVLDKMENDQELTSAAVYRYGKNWNNKHNPNSKNVHFSSDSSEWYTPPDIIERVVAVLGGIDLDPCSNSHYEPNVPATRHFTRDDDGLSQYWDGRVYMNPPYGNVIADWIDKLVYEHLEGRTTEAVALVPSRTDTVWFRALRAYPRCFLHGRLKFSGHDNSAPFPSMVVYLGENVQAFIEHFHDIGDVYEWVKLT